jgi:glycosyltransferase involved in cell wall biosynthesis
MHILLINYVYGAGISAPDELLRRYPTLTGWAEALVEAGTQVSVLLRFHREASLMRNGVDYEFISDRHPPRLRGWQIPIRLHRRAGQLARQDSAVAAHIHSLIFPLQTAALRASLPGRCAILAQHHADKPFRGWRKWLQRWGLSFADGFFFASQEQGQDWQREGIIRSSQPVFEVMEGSTSFTPGERLSARQRTGLGGEPLFLWVGRLDRNKDPLAVLAGFEQALLALPRAHLAMIYHTGELLPAVQERLAANPGLREAVSLVGRVPYDQLEPYYHSADYFVLGSHYEGSGYALAEAMACGVFPIVTDIPSFRMMTDQGRLGVLWPVGDAQALAAAMRRAAAQPASPRDTRQFFEQTLSYPAIAGRALAAYQAIAAQRLR